MAARSYLELVPEYQNREGEAHDIIEFQVKDFKKEQLKVQFRSNGVLTVSGERPLEGTRRIRFQKEFNTPKDCKANEIRARLSSGILNITIPKKTAPQISQEDALTAVQQASPPIQDKGKLKQESSQSEEDDDAFTAKQSPSDAWDEMATPTENATLPNAGSKSFISRLKIGRKTAMKVVASVTVLSLLFSLLFYMYKYYAPMIITDV
ncbi:hypothetical protein DITRI_Ditri06bG0126800 [Diplodiscus trichospermus]